MEQLALADPLGDSRWAALGRVCRSPSGILTSTSTRSSSSCALRARTLATCVARRPPNPGQQPVGCPDCSLLSPQRALSALALQQDPEELLWGLPVPAVRLLWQEGHPAHWQHQASRRDARGYRHLQRRGGKMQHSQDLQLKRSREQSAQLRAVPGEARQRRDSP